MPTAALQFDAERQFWKSFQDMADAQEPTGELTLLAPTAKGYSHVGQVFKTGAGAGERGRSSERGTDVILEVDHICTNWYKPRSPVPESPYNER